MLGRQQDSDNKLARSSAAAWPLPGSQPRAAEDELLEPGGLPSWLGGPLAAVDELHCAGKALGTLSAVPRGSEPAAGSQNGSWVGPAPAPSSHPGAARGLLGDGGALTLCSRGGAEALEGRGSSGGWTAGGHR